MNYDGTVLDTQKVVEYGDAVDPVTSGRIQTPTKPMDAQYTYAYSGWSGSLSSIAADRTVTAQYTSTVRSYTIRFLNGTSVLQSSEVAYGTVPAYSGTTPEGSNGTIFAGWSPGIAAVTGAQDYVAQFAELTVPSAVKTFAECSWAEIKAVAMSGYKNSSNQWCITRNDAEEVWWDIGDEKDITLSDGETLTLQIYDFLHDDKSDGTKLPLTIGLKNLMSNKMTMNDGEHQPPGGWKACSIRTYLNQDVLFCLPDELRLLIQESVKKNSYGENDIVVTNDKLFLLSYIEVDSEYAHVDYFKAEGSRYPIFTDKKSEVKKLPDGTSAEWWLRTANKTLSEYGFYFVWDTGGVNSSSIHWHPNSTLCGICFGFCI